ncbi:MAG: hypothetical protein KAS32_20085 [Candidatus Peribacteraceae bacterium]|nr:hypothetical protein [Candidatus Peribacteraceae bacterium]
MSKDDNKGHCPVLYGVPPTSGTGVRPPDRRMDVSVIMYAAAPTEEPFVYPSKDNKEWDPEAMKKILEESMKDMGGKVEIFEGKLSLEERISYLEKHVLEMERELRQLRRKVNETD